MLHLRCNYFSIADAITSIKKPDQPHSDYSNSRYFLKRSGYLTKLLEKYGTICSGNKEQAVAGQLVQGRKLTTMTFIKGDLAYAQGVF